MAVLSLKQETVEAFASQTTQKAASCYRRISQKKEDLLDYVPLLKKAKEKIRSFDQEMAEKFGKPYTKTRNIAAGIGMFFVAGQMGAPGLIALGTINAAKAIKPLLKEAEQQRQEGKVSGLIDYIKKNPKQSARSITVASLGAAAIGCGIAEAATGKMISRIGLTAVVVAPEIKNLYSTTKNWCKGTASFKDVRRDMAVVGLSAVAFFSGNAFGHHSETADHSVFDNDLSHDGMDHGTSAVSAEVDHSSGISVSVKGADKNKTPSSATQTAALSPVSDQKKVSESIQRKLQNSISNHSSATPEVKTDFHSKIKSVFTAQLQAKANNRALQQAASGR